MKTYILIITFCFVQLSFAQDFRFGKVSKEELQQVSDRDFPEVTASILYKQQSISFLYIQGRGFVQENEVYERIKIYNKEGFDYATKLISLYNNSQGSSAYNETLKGLKAVTYNLEGEKIVEDKLKKEGIFETTANKYWSNTKFTMPNIKVGSIIEFQYSIQSQTTSIDDINFQQLIPIKKLDIKIKTPEYFIYKRMINPRAAYVPTLNDSKEKGVITLTSKSRTQGSFGTVSTSFNSNSIDYFNNVISANLDNVPPLKNESHVDNLHNYQAKLILELERIEFPNEPHEYFSTSWEKVTNLIYEDSDFGGQLEKQGYYNSDLDLMLNGITNENEKVSKIFNFVKSKVKWNDYIGYRADLGVVKAYKDGIGSVADINLMLTAMLRHAGIKANPVLVSTKSNGVPLVPTRSGFNYVITAIETGDNDILLDASQKYTDINILPTNALNWLGRLIRVDGSSDWITLLPTFPSKENVSLNIQLNPDLSASGKIRNQYTNYQAMAIRNRFENYSQEEIIKNLERNKGEIEISNPQIENQIETSLPIMLSYDYNLKNASEDIGGKLYFSPMLFLAMKENPFKENTRDYPIDYVYPIADKYMINIIIPEGYEVESLPSNIKFEFKNGDAVSSFLANQNGNMLQFVVTFDLNKSIVVSTDYEQFKKFYQMVVEKQNEKVVLKKI